MCEQQIFARRDQKLAAARQERQANRLAATATKAENPKAKKHLLTPTQQITILFPSSETEGGSPEEQPPEG
ncbi:MAG: hypothetical protein ABSF95_15865 [Verrucomicrobiota bacterium]|jgi:hypothetical protein